ncbi:hypothetical protein ORJ04_22015 [Rheinheimera baltica]|uniref:Uncharacterized protein n=1 Tax=Rheinheimera baltica TaxID=67576 RepID=A0ABT9I5G0_9GAMM|nr:hypothetical protein [Rheinheimera baltica]MDP5138627.1 hypothetical protein [Rheinheimera baltica]MDP5151021.1 hypothetical protein [Rheinheimera baltica]
MYVRSCLLLLVLLCIPRAKADPWFDAGLISGGLTMCSTTTKTLTDEQKAVLIELSEKLFAASKRFNNAESQLNAGMLQFLEDLYVEDAQPFSDDTRPDVISLQECKEYQSKAIALLETIQ